MFWTIFLEREVLIKFLVFFFYKMITKQRNKPEMHNLWRHPYVIMHFSNNLQHHKTIFYLR